jgi:hypothetical protein
LNDWSLRNISVLGQITVNKTSTLPILVQCFTFLPNPPDHIIKQLQDIFSFLWDGNIAKVKRLTLTGNHAEVGEGVKICHTYCHLLKH